MEDPLLNLRKTLEDSLDDLSSPRTSSDVKTHALKTLERLLAAAFVPETPPEDLDYFLALQYTFECNVPSRILSWMASSTFRLDLLINQGTITSDAEPEVSTLTSQLGLALSIIQGVCLTHAPTKAYLGRRYALEVLLDLFISSRHLSSTPFASSSDSSSDSPLKPTFNSNSDSPLKPAQSNNSASPVKPAVGAPLPLASAILDTLLCVLVDSSPALRVFEACHGVHAVVKILKRAGTPREVRMKCLEFLYFYLLDETTSSSLPGAPSSSSSPSKMPVTPLQTPAPTAPSTPIHPSQSSIASTSRKPFPNATPARPTSRYGSSTFSLTSSSFVSSAFSSTPRSESSSSSSGSREGSRSTSGSSSSSFSSFSSTGSNAGSTPRARSPKKAASVAATPTKNANTSAANISSVLAKASATPSNPAAFAKVPGTPVRLDLEGKKQTQPRLLMLRKDLDFVPLSPKAPSTPKRAVVGGQGRARGPGAGAGHVRTKSRLASDEASEDTACDVRDEGEVKIDQYEERGECEREDEGGGGGEGGEARTTDEKKQLLATMLGNVEALVEGVRKAGIWGLG